MQRHIRAPFGASHERACSREQLKPVARMHHPALLRLTMPCTACMVMHYSTCFATPNCNAESTLSLKLSSRLSQNDASQARGSLLHSVTCHQSAKNGRNGYAVQTRQRTTSRVRDQTTLLQALAIGYRVMLSAACKRAERLMKQVQRSQTVRQSDPCRPADHQLGAQQARLTMSQRLLSACACHAKRCPRHIGA